MTDKRRGTKEKAKSKTKCALCFVAKVFKGLIITRFASRLFLFPFVEGVTFHLWLSNESPSQGFTLGVFLALSLSDKSFFFLFLLRVWSPC